jgi:hypothetical protein
MAETGAPIEAVVDALNAASVDYVLIGGAAMMLHGVAYVTRDVDVCYARNAANVAALVEALAPFRPTLRLANGESVPFLWETRTVLNGSNFTLQTLVGDVDILGTVTGIGSYEDAAGYSKRYIIGEREVPMFTIEGLIVSKRAAGRVKDKLVLPELEVLRGLGLLIEPEHILDLSSLPVYEPEPKESSSDGKT